MLSARLSLRFGWGFWALVVAWVCAQSPQAAVFGIVNWASGAAHISHHDRLVVEVERAISAGGESDAAVIAVVQSKADEERGKPVALPMGSVVEKLFLALAERERLVGEEVPEVIFGRAEDWFLGLSAAGEPLHPPPRSV